MPHKIFERSIFVAAPALTVWHAFFNVQRWKDWNSSILRVELLEVPKASAIGRIYPVGGRPFHFQITQVIPELFFQWERPFKLGTKYLQSFSITPNAEGVILTMGALCEGRLEKVAAFLSRHTLERELEIQAAELKAWAEGQTP